MGGRPVLITGAGGLLGGCVADTYRARGVEVVAADHARLDITDREQVLSFVASSDPGVIVHCAAMTNVDLCEERPDDAFAVNAQGSRNVAQAAAKAGAALVIVSTDYVFSGSAAPYAEDAATDPIQVYGRSKLEGEIAATEECERSFIVRSAWIYGHGGKNFLSKLPELAEKNDSITAVTDQRGNPTFAPDLAEAIADLVAGAEPGIYHVVNDGSCTFAGFCERAVEILGSDLRIEGVSIDDLGRPAPRPKNTMLSYGKWLAAGFPALRPWQDAAHAFLTSLPADT